MATDCSLIVHGQSHMNNFYIVELENVATASHRCIGVINKSRRRLACGLHLRWSSASWPNTQVYHTLVEPCNSITTSSCSGRASCSSTVMQQLKRFRLTHHVARSVCGSRASCSLTETKCNIHEHAVFACNQPLIYGRMQVFY